MSLKEKIADVLERVSFSTAKTVGAEWDALRQAIVDEVGELEQRVAAIETQAALSAATAPKKK